MTGKTRISLWFHAGDPTEGKVLKYMQDAKKNGKTYVQYITSCVLAYEEGTALPTRSDEIDLLAEKLAKKIRVISSSEEKFE